MTQKACPQHIFISQPLPLGRAEGSAPHSEEGRNLGGRYLDFLCGHESAYGKI